MRGLLRAHRSTVGLSSLACRNATPQKSRKLAALIRIVQVRILCYSDSLDMHLQRKVPSKTLARTQADVEALACFSQCIMHLNAPLQSYMMRCDAVAGLECVEQV